MLIEIRCDKFREKVIKFHSGLNVVLGDEKATNSIGKTILLMLVDYAFRGDSFVKQNTDVVDELGHHDYFFTFTFGNEKYTFKRGTFRPDLVYNCTTGLDEVEPISLDEYKSFLRMNYGLDSEDITFRAFVSLFSRIWGKDNVNVKKPIHTVQVQKASQCVDNLLRIFSKYGSIKEIAHILKSLNDEKDALNVAYRKQIIPKITKTKYKDNSKKISAIELEIQDIKSNLAKYATNIAEIANREMLDLKVQKDELLGTKIVIEDKLLRVRNNLSNKRHIKSKHLESLSKFFPSVNLTKLAEIEEFHSGLSKILKKELKANESELSARLDLVTREIDKIDTKISSMLSSLENPSVIVDRVYEISRSLGSSRQENEYYETSETNRKKIKETKTDLSSEKIRILKLVEDIINDNIRKLVTNIYSKKRKSPVLKLGEDNYSYEVFEDTGTGKAYSSLIIFDLSVFSTTKLPILVHDSLLFKNIENAAVAKIVDLYMSHDKQSFISIDEISKYGKVASKNLSKNKVIKLQDDKVLYIKDWRK